MQVSIKKSIVKVLFLVGIIYASSSFADTVSSIGVRTMSFYDITRGRPIITELFYPTKETIGMMPVNDVWSNLWVREPEVRDAPIPVNNKKYPLILFSHGDRSDRIMNTWLIYSLVKNGYIVASVDHYGNTDYLILPELELHIYDRPLDISFVLKNLLQHSFIQNNIDVSRIGFVGFSKGGATGILLAGGISQLSSANLALWKKAVPDFSKEDLKNLKNIDFQKMTNSYRDPLIKAAFLTAPAWGQAFDPTSLQKIQIPLYIVAGQKDDIAPIEDNAKYYAKWIPHATLSILSGKVGHFVFLNNTTALGKKLLLPLLVKDDITINREKIHNQVSEEALRFFSKNLN